MTAESAGYASQDPLDPSVAPASVDQAIERALLQDYPEYGAREFEGLMREGFRSLITDRLLDRLEREEDQDQASRVIGLLYAIQGTVGYGEPKGIRPFAYVGNPNEPISREQYHRLIMCAARESRPLLYWDYVATIECIGRFALIDDFHRQSLRSFCNACKRDGLGDAKARASRVLLGLDRLKS